MVGTAGVRRATHAFADQHGHSPTQGVTVSRIVSRRLCDGFRREIPYQIADGRKGRTRFIAGMLDRAEQHIARSAGVARANVRIVGKERFDRGRACIVARMVCEEVPVAARGVDQLVADLVGEFGDRVAIAEYREPAPVTGADRFKRRFRQIRGFGDRDGRDGGADRRAVNDRVRRSPAPACPARPAEPMPVPPAPAPAGVCRAPSPIAA